MARATPNGTTKEPSIEDLTKQIDTLRKDLGDLTSLMAEMGKARGAHLGAEAAAAAREQAEDIHVHTHEFIHAQPATAMGLAAGIGFLVGLLIARR